MSIGDKMRGLILAGGTGTRLRPLTHTGPKQLIPIANKPVILYALEDLKEAGITDIGVILGNNMPEQVKELLGDGSTYGVKITYIVQGAPKGIAHAVGISQEFMGDAPFVVYLGDNILKSGIKDMVDEFLQSDYDAMIALSKVRDPQRFGVAELDKKGEVIRLVEKPKEPKSDLALVGVYLFRSAIFDAIKTLKSSWRNELEITEAIDKLMASKEHKVHSHIVKGWWKDTGKPEDILEANKLVLGDIKQVVEGTVEKNATIHAPVSIGERSVVRSGSVIKGPVVIGRNCIIGPDAHIGPHTSIGDGSIIKSANIESSVIMGEVTIDCNKKIIDSLIGRKTEILTAKNLPKGYRFVIGESSFIQL